MNNLRLAFWWEESCLEVCHQAGDMLRLLNRGKAKSREIEARVEDLQVRRGRLRQTNIDAKSWSQQIENRSSFEYSIPTVFDRNHKSESLSAVFSFFHRSSADSRSRPSFFRFSNWNSWSSLCTTIINMCEWEFFSILFSLLHEKFVGEFKNILEHRKKILNTSIWKSQGEW